ncbi:tyrosine-type recombinase/integrase [Sinorhizobium meliloti]|uniref:tyrosine-type recombinase/integrase n=1 Tax=Rhizobium meliloti TaxID=382 RepID=UPI000FD97139|nr:tyrosine-type recombinase/integrase [Sinorhizobium meliloti]MDW9409568.1 tyrosine-type recombinase/integrase [Sinorhizobium meliloti]MDW9440928.1 tyrosine-type recombinase/integrase [Sinorhizobium meliloti]MDW9454970.1 tyrosine-type recombinase/integrase [Sinorhizobium meliloti]MDW9467132.1 tyrosine-type recombinase/integrase [Sinorhizobium meliloti]MDW9519163.1 tyrosine-type recombinase/integrase [Sinorhizobium meliloti]
MQITDNFIERRVPKLVAGCKEKWFNDAKMTGFSLRVRQGKNDTLNLEFYAVRYIGKSREKMLIGDTGTYTADEARQQARQIIQAWKEGNDPKALKAQKIAAPTIAELWMLFDKEHLALKEASTRKDYRGRYNRIIKPTFGSRKVADITQAEIAALKLKFRNKPYDCNRGIAVLSKMMSHAILNNMRKDNPCKAVPRFTETSNDTWIDEKQLPPFLEALAKADGPVADLLRFVTVSGWRISAARLLRWDQVDLSRLEVHLDDKATKKTATALSTDAAAIIAAQPHRIGFVFSNSGGRRATHYKDSLDQLTAICKEAGIPRMTPHRLRASIATHSAIDGANVAELMQSFGWKTPAIAMRYVKKSESLARKGVERAAAIVNIFNKQPADVIKLHK